MSTSEQAALLVSPMVKAVMLDGLADYTGRTSASHDEPWWNLNMPKALDIMLSHLLAHGYTIEPPRPTEDEPAEASSTAGSEDYQPSAPNGENAGPQRSHEPDAPTSEAGSVAADPATP